MKFVNILIEYDDVLNQQRIVVYRYRRDVLEGEERAYELIRDFIAQTVEDIVFEYVQNVLLHKNKLIRYFMN